MDKLIDECEDLSLQTVMKKILFDFRKDCHCLRLPQLNPYLFQHRIKSLKSIYVLGGYKHEEGSRWSENETVSCVEFFNTYQQTWNHSANMQHPRFSHGATV